MRSKVLATALALLVVMAVPSGLADHAVEVEVGVKNVAPEIKAVSCSVDGEPCEKVKTAYVGQELVVTVEVEDRNGDFVAGLLLLEQVRDPGTICDSQRDGVKTTLTCKYTLDKRVVGYNRVWVQVSDEPNVVEKTVAHLNVKENFYVTLSPTKLEIPTLEPGREITHSVTLETTAPARIYVKGRDLMGKETSISVSNIKIRVSFLAHWVTLSDGEQYITATLPTDLRRLLYVQVHCPLGTRADTYKGSIHFIVKPVDP